MVFSQSGYAEDNCVFRTDFPQDIIIESYDDEAFIGEVVTLEKMLNHYLENGEMLKVFEESKTP